VNRLLADTLQREVSAPASPAAEAQAEARSFVNLATEAFRVSAAGYARAPVSPSPEVLLGLLREEWERLSRGRGFFGRLVALFETLLAAARRASSPEALLREISRMLRIWRRVYEGARGIIQSHLGGAAALSERLRDAYLSAIEAMHRSVRDRTPRVSINLVAAPPAAGDSFIRNATDYARAYFMRPVQPDDLVVMRENVGSPGDLLDIVEGIHPERMIRRIDIFAHGTIQPSNQIRFGASWNTVADIEAAAAGRRFTSAAIQSIGRFDDRSAMELHACRLGAGTGQRFLEGMGRAVGGEHGQAVSAYRQRWYPRRFEISWTWAQPGAAPLDVPVINTQNDIYGPNAIPDRNGQPGDHNAFVTRFENYAVQVFDDVVAGSLEVRPFLSAAERAGGAVTRARKIEIMRAMYDQHSAWLLGFLHPAAGAAPNEPRAAAATAAHTFTSEAADWQAQVLTVRVNPPAPAAPAAGP